MTNVLSTRRVAKNLGVPVSRLSQAVWRGSISEPEKGPGGSFLWTDADIQRAARYFNIKLRGDINEE